MLKGLRLSVSFGKCGLISESLSFWLKSPKKMPNVANDSPEHHLLIGGFKDLSQSESN